MNTEVIKMSNIPLVYNSSCTKPNDDDKVSFLKQLNDINVTVTHYVILFLSDTPTFRFLNTFEKTSFTVTFVISPKPTIVN